jgi:hypothetical protein
MGMLKQAFNAVTKIHSRKAVLTRFGVTDTDADQLTELRITPSNYFRNLEGPSATIIRGREFIIPVDSIVNKFSPVLKRGDKIEDELVGSMALDEITEMHDLGGSILGYRVRVE